jgi:soluble lytic murein transglycosylase-like protein
MRGRRIHRRLASWLVAVAALAFAQAAHAGEHDYDGLIATHARANHVPEALVHRVIRKESRYHPDLVGHGGTIGLMQIKLATARGVGYTGDADGLRDPDTNLAYGVKYLAGAWRVANGDHERAMHYYASGYYGVAKQQWLEPAKPAAAKLASAAPKAPAKTKEVGKPKPAPMGLTEARAEVSRPPADIPASPAKTAKPR